MSRSAPTNIDIGRFYTPQPVQRKFHASDARYPLLEGGRGGGKSTALLWEAISQCLLVPGANCLLLRRTLTAMEKGGIEDLFKKQVPRSLYRRYNATKHVITFYKGSNRCPIKTYEHQGRMYAVRPRMAGGTNPNGKGSGWVKAMWITKKPVGEMAAKYDPTEYEAIHSTYQDNLVYRDDANYIASLESIVDPVLRQAWIPRSWDILAGQFFQNWDPARHVKSFSQCVFESWQPRWISIDWGFEHATVVLWWTRVRIKTDLDQKAERTVLLCYQHHSIADKMGDIFVQYDLPRPERANNRRVDGWRLCYTLLDTDGLAG